MRKLQNNTYFNLANLTKLMAIKKAVVLAAGEGKRLRPLTYTRPKCMIQLAGRPILHHVISNLKKAGVEKAALVVKYKEDSIRTYFEKNDLGVDIDFITQGNKYGTAAAFLEAKEWVGNDEFLGVAGDVITERSALNKLASSHEGTVTAALKRVEDPREYGIAELKNGKIEKFTEKPKNPKSSLANCSLYAFGSRAMEKIGKIKKSERGEYEITDLLVKQNAKAVEIGEYWLDMGMPWQLFSANKFILSKMSEKKGKIENSTIKGKLAMGEGAEIIDSYIEGPLYLGKNTVVGPHAYIRGVTSIGNGCCIGDSTTVKNSIIFDDVNAKHLTYIGDSIVGEGCNFGAATQIANFRFDAGAIKARVNDVVIDTRMNKLGAILGDGVKMGVISSVMPGRMIGDHSWVGANVMVYKNIPRKKKVLLKQNLDVSDI